MKQSNVKIRDCHASTFCRGSRHDNQAATWINQMKYQIFETRGIMMHINDSSPSNKTCFYIWPIIIILLIISASCAARNSPTDSRQRQSHCRRQRPSHRRQRRWTTSRRRSPYPRWSNSRSRDASIPYGSWKCPDHRRKGWNKSCQVSSTPTFIEVSMKTIWPPGLRGGVTTVRDESIIDSRPLKELIACGIRSIQTRNMPAWSPPVTCRRPWRLRWGFH